MDDSIQRIKEINEEKSKKLLEKAKHEDLVLANIQTQQVIVQVANSLVEYLDNKENKTEVTNQLTEIGTPDALVVARAVDSLHDTMQGLENTDLTEVTKVMQSILDEAKKIPKELPKEKEQKFVDYTPQLKSLGEAVKAVEKVVKAQKLIAEAPVINVPETNVNVDAPDLKPLQKGLKDVVSAVNKVVIPETDTKEMEKLLKASNKLLKDLLKKPVSSGGGGGGSAWPALGTNGFPAPLNLDSSGNLKTTATLSGDITASTEYTEDVASVADPIGGMTMARRRDTLVTNEVSADGDNIALNATNKGQLHVKLADTVTVDGSGVTQPVSGTVAVTNAGLTELAGAIDTEMQVDVVGALPAGTNNIGDVDVASSALPTGASTSAKQDTIIGHVDGIEGLLTTIDADTGNIATEVAGLLTDTELRATPVPVSGTVTATPTGTQNVDVTANTIGLATGAKQDTGNTSVASIDTKTPALGQALAAASVPVILPSATITTLTPPAAITGFATAANQLPDGHNVTVDNASLAVTGTFWQATQPVSGTVTETNSAAIKTAVETIDNAISGSEMQVDVVGALPAGTNILGGVNPTPSGAAAQALSNDTSTAYEASSVTKASAGTVYGVTGYNSRTTAQFFQFYNSTTVPADTAVPVITIYVSATSNFSIDFGVYGRRFSTGIAWSNSSTGATKTIGSADMFVDVNYV